MSGPYPYPYRECQQCGKQIHVGGRSVCYECEDAVEPQAMTDDVGKLESEVLAKCLPLTQEIAGLIGDLSASEIVWINERISDAFAANSRLPLSSALSVESVIRNEIEKVKADMKRYNWVPHSPAWDRAFGEIAGMSKVLSIFANE